MKSILLNVQNGEVKEVDPKGLDDYYALIGCRLVTIVTLGIGGKYYDIICDDEGLLVEGPQISAIDNMGQPMLCGNLIIAGMPQNEECTDLTESDIRHIRKNIHWFGTRLHPEGYPMLCQVHY